MFDMLIAFLQWVKELFCLFNNNDLVMSCSLIETVLKIMRLSKISVAC